MPKKQLCYIYALVELNGTKKKYLDGEIILFLIRSNHRMSWFSPIFLTRIWFKKGTFVYTK